MRKLQLQDAFKVSRLIKKTGVKDTLVNAFKEGKKEGASQEDIGVDTLFEVLEAVSEEKNEAAIYEFMAGIAETDPEKVKCMSFEELKGFFRELAKENDLEGFLKLVKKSM